MIKIPVVAIIGRQNVGKSTIFNRLIKSRKAIIDSIPGVTRDLVYGDININGMNIKLVDSGGISDNQDIINKLVQKKTIEAQKDADLILFIVEAGNPHPIENEYINLIRKLNKKTLIIVNKCDTIEKDLLKNDYFNYGFGEPISISAEHNRNIDLLKDRIFSILKTINKDNDEIIKDKHDIKIAIIGKPNVGKSSLLNCIIKKERSIVSEIAGTTRDLVDEEFQFDGKNILIIDTAGIRKKTKVKEDIEYYSVKRAINTIESADIILLVIDSIEDISDQDKKITDQIVKNGKGLIVVLNKWDLQQKDSNTFKKKQEFLLFKFPILKYVPIIPVSAKTGEGIKSVLKKSIEIFDEIHKRIETSQLNTFIQDVIRKYSPSSKNGILKIYYGTQTGIKPIEFVFFINNKNLLTKSYQQYIINCLRDKFGFSGIPIKVSFKDKKE